MPIGGTSQTMTDSSVRVEMQSVSEEKDLGVNMMQVLKTCSQCAKAANKARSVVGMVHRNFRRLDQDDFLLLYKTYIRPHMEYCILYCTWSPYLA